ncbi:hypothetical protein AVEN_207847-1 [Araneus ventricosus]|uniref:Uncharacterized protein n=1 Tax=Araneus ventricosus TaxID=182803 RepID=A0A4Y2NCM3_ARAVE|nr:hypothetical protein AVEN_207847-1 [Araneus ventricosus]
MDLPRWGRGPSFLRRAWGSHFPAGSFGPKPFGWAVPAWVSSSSSSILAIDFFNKTRGLNPLLAPLVIPQESRCDSFGITTRSQLALLSRCTAMSAASNRKL